MPKAQPKKPATKPAAKGGKPTNSKSSGKSGSSGSSSLAAMWEETDAAEASSFPPAGEHVMRLSKAHLESKGKKNTAFLSYEILDGEHEGKKGRSRYNLTDDSGERGPGFAYLKADFALLGKDNNMSGKEFLKTFDELTEEQPMCIVRVTVGEYTNFRLQGLADGDGTGGESGGDVEIEVGDDVTWIDDEGKEKKGSVIKIEDDEATVKTAKGKVKVSVSELQKEGAEENESEGEIEVGDEVTFPDPKDSDNELEGVVTEVDGTDISIKSGKKVYVVEADDVKKKTEEEEEVTVSVGDSVSFKDPEDDDETLTGKIIDIDGTDITVKVGKKSYSIEPNEILSDDERGGGEEVEIEVGDTVKFTADDEEKTGIVIKIEDDEAVVKDEDKVKHTVSISDLEKED